MKTVLKKAIQEICKRPKTAIAISICFTPILCAYITLHYKTFGLLHPIHATDEQIKLLEDIAVTTMNTNPLSIAYEKHLKEKSKQRKTARKKTPAPH